MTAPRAATADPLRRLPGDGRAVYVSTGGVLEDMADAIEAQLVDGAAEVLRLARALLHSDARLTADEWAYTARRLAECLRDALCVAEVRGERLGMDD